MLIRINQSEVIVRRRATARGRLRVCRCMNIISHDGERCWVQRAGLSCVSRSVDRIRHVRCKARVLGSDEPERGWTSDDYTKLIRDCKYK